MAEFALKRYEHEARGWGGAMVDRLLSTESIIENVTYEVFIPIRDIPKGPNSTIPFLRQVFNADQVLTMRQLIAQPWIASTLISNPDIYPFDSPPLAQEEVIHAHLKFNEGGMLLFTDRNGLPDGLVAGIDYDHIRRHLRNIHKTGMDILIPQGGRMRRSLRQVRLVPIDTP